MPYMLILILLVSASCGFARELISEPLNITTALRIAEDKRNLHVSQATLAQSIAKYQIGITQAEKGFHTDLFANAEFIEPSVLSSNQDRDDHVLGLSIKKRLIDFGAQRYQIRSKKDLLRLEQIEQAHALNQYKLLVMQRFFAVLLSDLQYRRDNEAMAVAYVRLDKARHRRKLGGVSDVDVLNLESLYEESRGKRMQSQTQQNVSRELLANTLQIRVPKNLMKPNFKSFDGKPPELEKLYKSLQKNNPQLMAMQAKLQSVKNEMIALRRSQLPHIDLGVDAWSYNRQLGNRDKWRAGLRLNWTLSDGRKTSQLIGEKVERYELLKVQMALLKTNLNEQVLLNRNKWLRLKLRDQELKVLGRYRELNLDRQRALYELEVQTNLGDTMVQMSDLEFQRGKNQYEMILTQSRLAILCGKKVKLGEWCGK